VRHQNEERLFSYGTLQSEAVQMETFGRTLSGSADALVGYRLVMLRIEDQEFVVKSGTADHRNLQFTGDDADLVEGTVLTLTVDELYEADAYEPQPYERVSVRLRSGASAWVYMANQQT
jgi:gamma-glutamylcyclotransferase (GGCT)/AIG2-like uncharacterized protein YtfP